MKSIISIFSLFFAVAVFAALPQGKVNADKVNLRMGPGLKHPVAGMLVNGQQVEICSVNGSWLELSVPENLTAYVSEARINADGVLNGELNMRTRMSTAAPILGVLPKGTKVERLDKRANGWVQIKVPASSGVKVYAASFLVNFNSAEFDENGKPVTGKAEKTAVKAEEKSVEPEVKESAAEAKEEKAAEVKKEVEKTVAEPEAAAKTETVAEKSAAAAPAAPEKIELKGVLVKWKYSNAPETAYALLTEKDGFNQAFIIADDAALLARAENKTVKISGISAGRYGEAGAIILKANVISVL